MFMRIFLIFALLISFLYSQDIEFSADSAYQYIEHLSVTIGPRTMGSAEEREALDWTMSKFRSFGADISYILPFTVAEARRGKYITNSGTAIGMFKGKTDSSIVIGGHLDSAGPEYPGANDNASGTATVIELARLWSQRPHLYTMIFCAFGGEEVGLHGSRHFVNNFSQIDDVVLMISADMGGTDSDIEMMFETDSMQAPKWLVQDAYNADAASGFNHIVYPTHFSTQNNLSSKGSGSDHVPFLNKGIPAIDFTSDPTDSPIHSQQDKIDFIDKTALGNYGNFIDQLLLKYQNGGIESSEAGSEEFMLWQVAGLKLYIPIWLLIIFNSIAIILGIGTFIIARRNRMIVEKSKRIRVSGLKTFIIFIIILIFAQLGEAFIQLFKGFRYSWYLHIGPYLVYNFIWALSGLWVGLQLTRKWKFSPDSYIYSKRALIVLFIFTVASLFLSARLAFYPAFMLLFVSIAILVQKEWIKILLIILSPLLMTFLLFNEEFTFMSRMMSNTGFQIDNFIKALMFNALLVAFMSLWYLPMLNAFTYLTAVNEYVKNALKIYRKPIVAGGLLVIIIGFGIYLGTLTPYNEMWKPSIYVDANYELPEGKAELTILGNEYFKDVKVTGDTLMEYIDTRMHKVEVPLEFTADWIGLSGYESINQVLMDTVQVDSIKYNWSICSDEPYMRITFTIQTDTANIINPKSDLPFTHNEKSIQYVWYGFMGDTLNVTGNFKAEPGAKIIRKISARYVGLPVDLKVESQLASVRYRTTVQYSDTLSFDIDRLVMKDKLHLEKRYQ